MPVSAKQVVAEFTWQTKNQDTLEPEIHEDWFSESLKQMPGSNTQFSRKRASVELVVEEFKKTSK